MRHIIAFICCFVIAAFMLFGFNNPASVIKAYSSVVEVIGKSQLTSNFMLIGERYDSKDDYTGGYRCSAENKTGRDIVYGGCTVKSINIRVKGQIDKTDGSVKVYTRIGKDVEEIIPDENGCFDENLTFDGGDSYVFVQYERFSGSIDFKTEYI